MILPSGTASLKLEASRGLSSIETVVQTRSCAGLDGRKIEGVALQQSRPNAGHKRFFGISDGGDLLTFGAQIFTQCKVSCTCVPEGVNERLVLQLLLCLPSRSKQRV